MERLAKLKVPNAGQAMGQLFPLLGLITVIKQTMPPEGHEALNYCRRVMRSLLNPFCFYTINEFEGTFPNDLYKDIHLHLESCKAYNKARRVTLFRQPNTSSLTMRLSDSRDVVVDTYKGMTVWWTHYEGKKDKLVYRGPFNSGGGASARLFQLRIRKRDKAKLLPEYLDFITENSSKYSSKTRDIKIYTNSDGHGYHQLTTSGSRRMWEEIPYKHPSTFATLAMDPCLKEKIISDLTTFTTDKLFYERTGRAWKRGYLLYGPPGTGKSSMIAAMANLLKYDIYDLELSQVRTNGDLRQLLIQTTNRSIIVLEDIDCSVKFTSSRTGFGRGRNVNRSTMQMPGDLFNPEDDPNRVTLSGLLNFVDGLWSCCGDERIFVFTTNHIEKLDKALLRPGRMDMQIELSYCTFSAFRVLAQNYLSIQEHPLFEKLESAFVGKTMTPAQVAELLIKDKRDVDIALESVISALENNVPESPEAENSAPDADSKDPATTCEDANSGGINNQAPQNFNLGMESLSKNGKNEDLVSVLQGVIEALQKNTDFQSVPSQQSQAGSSTNGNVRDFVQSVKATLLRSAAEGDLDSAIEGVVQGLATKLSMPEIQQIFNVGLPHSAGKTVATGCDSASAAPGIRSLALSTFTNGSSPKAAATNGTEKEESK